MAADIKNNQSFKVKHHGDIAVIIPATEVESMPENLIYQAAEIVLAPCATIRPRALSSI